MEKKIFFKKILFWLVVLLTIHNTYWLISKLTFWYFISGLIYFVISFCILFIFYITKIRENFFDI
jgi:hypothetical protein